MENETLGKRIKRLREAKRLSQPELAKLLTVSSKSVANWEADRNHPRSSMGALLDIFGPALVDGDEGDEPAGDAVLAAIKQSELDDWRQDEVRSVYRRNLQAQRAEARGA